MTFQQEQKPCLWENAYVIENLPIWIYTDNRQPTTMAECRAKISSIEYTIKDIDLQIEIRELELKTGSSRHQSSFDYEKWRTQALRAKQTHLYLLNAYSYWSILNEKEFNEQKISNKVNNLIQLLIEEPSDFVKQLEKLIECV
jgi:hypothetical protein